MEDIIEHNGKKYKKILSNGAICEGCAFLDKGTGPLSGIYACKAIGIGDGDRFHCVATTPVHNIQNYIFKELPE